ncbi:MAG TPA: hypothetical protein VF614_07315 [Chthoniobacteraceae bacterium]|jgi:hypothetical protein
MTRFTVRLVAAVTLSVCAAYAEAGDALSHNLRLAAQRPEWKQARAVSSRLHCIREAALQHSVVSTPVSDRYLITELGGPLDLVHFLGLGMQVCSGELTREQALLQQWQAEGGADFEARRTSSFPTEAHPDDLPSNALGALLGQELRVHELKAEFDVGGALRTFLQPLIPVSSAAVRRYSHAQVVMGLPADPSRKQSRARREWFTAEPLYLLPLLNPARAQMVRTSADALRLAGFGVHPIAGRPIGILRIK